MSTIVQQPHTLEPADRDQLGILGHRIEVWNAAKTGDGSLDDRAIALVQELVQLISMMEHSKYEISPVELGELEADLDELYAFAGDEDTFAQFCEEREQYYAAVRASYIQNLLPTNDESDPVE